MNSKRKFPLILDSLRIDINDLKDDARHLVRVDENGYFEDDGSIFWNLCLRVDSEGYVYRLEPI